MRIVERLSWADGSAGWCTMVANVQAASGGAHLPPEGARLVYGNGPDVSMAGSFMFLPGRIMHDVVFGP